MGRSTRSAVGSALSDKTAVAGTNASPPAPQETTPTQQPRIRSSRRLAINNNHAPLSIDTPSNIPKLAKSDTSRAYVATTATAPPTHRRGKTSATSATRKDVENAPIEGDLNEKENKPPTTSYQTRTRSRKSRSIDKECTIILSGDVTETVESVEKQEPILILAIQTDNKPLIEPVTEATIKILPAAASSIDASQQKERDQQQKQQVAEDSAASPAVTQEKRKWARRTKVVKLEDVASPVPTPKDRTANEEGEDDEDDEEEEEEEDRSSDSEDSDGEYGKASKRRKVEKSVPLFKSTPDSELSEYGTLCLPFHSKNSLS